MEWLAGQDLQAVGQTAPPPGEVMSAGEFSVVHCVPFGLQNNPQGRAEPASGEPAPAGWHAAKVPVRFYLEAALLEKGKVSPSKSTSSLYDSPSEAYSGGV